MSQLSDNSDHVNENRKIMKLNIIRHRQKVLKLYGITDTMVLKSIIELNPRDLKITNVNNNIEKEPIVKEDVTVEIQPKIENSNSDVPVGSNEWDGVYEQYPGGSIVNNKRKSKRLETMKQNHNDTKRKSEYVYDLPSHIITNKKTNLKKKQIKETVTLSNLQTKEFKPKNGRNKFNNVKDDTTKALHNLKERESRKYLASLFLDLKKLCSYLNTNKRNPSKCSILLAARTECNLLSINEKRLLAEKEEWDKLNKCLRKKLRNLKYE